MKYIFGFILTIGIGTVTATSYKDFVSNLPSDSAKISVRGSVSVLNNNYGFTYHLCLKKVESYDDVKGCVDLVFTDKSVEASMVPGCFDVVGEFKRYSSERVGLGWLISKHGLVEVQKIEKIKC